MGACVLSTPRSDKIMRNIPGQPLIPPFYARIDRKRKRLFACADQTSKARHRLEAFVSIALIYSCRRWKDGVRQLELTAMLRVSSSRLPSCRKAHERHDQVLRRDLWEVGHLGEQCLK